jgi:hypothetical protein
MVPVDPGIAKFSQTNQRTEIEFLREAVRVQPIISINPTGFTILRAWCKGIQIDNLAIPHRDDQSIFPHRCDA